MKRKRYLIVMFTLCFVLLAGCGEESLDTPTAVKAIDLAYTESMDTCFAANGEWGYMLEWAQDGEQNTLILHVIDLTSGEVTTQEIHSGQGEREAQLATLYESNHVAVILCERQEDTRYTMFTLSGSGELLDTTDVTDVFKQGDFITAVKADRDGYLYLSVANGSRYSVLVLDEDWQYVARLDYLYQIHGLYTTLQSGVIVKCHDPVKETYEMRTISVAEKSWGKNLSLSTGANRYFDGAAHDLYTIEDAVLYSIDTEAGKQTPLYSWDEGRFGVASYLYGVSDDTFFAVTKMGIYLVFYGEQDGGEHGAESAPEKTELVLAGSYFDSDIYAVVNAFNTANDDISIIIREYPASGELFKSVSSMMLDIAAGDIPDMFLFPSGSGWPLDILMAQGLFIDLYPLLDGDQVISKTDFFPNLLDVVAQDSGLYYFPINFSLKGIVGPPEYAQEGQFPLDIVKELRQRYPDDDMMFGGLAPMQLILMELYQNADHYVNWEAKACNFTSERFLQVLEAAYYLPEYKPEGTEEFIDFFSGAYILAGRQLFDIYTISDLDIHLLNIGATESSHVYVDRFGGDMAFMNLSDSGAIMNMGQTLAISSACDTPDKAWQFLREFLFPDYQQTISKALPISATSFDARVESFLAEGMGTEEDFARVTELIASVSNTNKPLYEPIYEIVRDEVLAYLAGDKTAEQVADVIQNKASTFLAEF